MLYSNASLDNVHESLCFYTSMHPIRQRTPGKLDIPHIPVCCIYLWEYWSYVYDDMNCIQFSTYYHYKNAFLTIWTNYDVYRYQIVPIFLNSVTRSFILFFHSILIYFFIYNLNINKRMEHWYISLLLISMESHAIKVQVNWFWIFFS